MNMSLFLENNTKTCFSFENFFEFHVASSYRSFWTELLLVLKEGYNIKVNWGLITRDRMEGEIKLPEY